MQAAATGALRAVERSYAQGQAQLLNPACLDSGVICSSFSCTRKFVCTAQVCMLHLYLNPSPALCTGCACRSTPGYLGPPSVLQGLCTMAEFVCLATLSFLSPRSVGGHPWHLEGSVFGTLASLYSCFQLTVITLSNLQKSMHFYTHNNSHSELFMAKI